MKPLSLAFELSLSRAFELYLFRASNRVRASLSRDVFQDDFFGDYHFDNQWWSYPWSEGSDERSEGSDETSRLVWCDCMAATAVVCLTFSYSIALCP